MVKFPPLLLREIGHVLVSTESNPSELKNYAHQLTSLGSLIPKGCVPDDVFEDLAGKLDNVLARKEFALSPLTDLRELISVIYCGAALDVFIDTTKSDLTTEVIDASRYDTSMSPWLTRVASQFWLKRSQKLSAMDNGDNSRPFRDRPLNLDNYLGITPQWRRDLEVRVALHTAYQRVMEDNDSKFRPSSSNKNRSFGNISGSYKRPSPKALPVLVPENGKVWFEFQIESGKMYLNLEVIPRSQKVSSYLWTKVKPDCVTTQVSRSVTFQTQYAYVSVRQRFNKGEFTFEIMSSASKPDLRPLVFCEEW